MTGRDGGYDLGVAFSLTLRAVIVLTFMLLVLWVTISLLVPDPNRSVSTLIDGISHAFTACLGGLLGLLGGKLAG